MMNIQDFFKLYLLTTPIFFGIDMIWLSAMNKRFYGKYLGDLLTKDVNWTAAILFYLIYIVAILVFAIIPGLREDSLAKATIQGAFLGFVAYATYDLTNLATLKNWPLNVTLIDIIWGTVLTGAVALFGFLVAKNILKF